jgi:hypothetical protein
MLRRDIGKAFDAGQTRLNLVAVGYSLGLAAAVLYLRALGDRYGRKLMLIVGTVVVERVRPVRRHAAVQPHHEPVLPRPPTIKTTCWSVRQALRRAPTSR